MFLLLVCSMKGSQVSDKHSKTVIILHMPTVHPVLLQTARTELLVAWDVSIISP